MSLSQYQLLKDTQKKKNCIKELIPVDSNLVDLVWNLDRKPLPPCTPTFLLSNHEAFFSTRSKLEKVREMMKNNRTTACVLTHLDEIAWLCNLRASDINYCPLFISYMLILLDECRLYVATERLNDECLTHLKSSEITLRPYLGLFEDLEALSGTGSVHNKIWIPPSVNMKVYTCIHGEKHCTLVNTSPVETLKATKTDSEIESLRQAHIVDGLSKVAFLCWLEDLAKDSQALQQHTEWTVAKKLEDYRRLMPENQGLSFETISSIGTNTAIIHYAPDHLHAKSMSHDIYLVDSGGQYLGGTTDVTRTLHLGIPSARQKKIWTCVLKGHLQLARMKFPKGTVGPQLDVLCRQFLWMEGLNYLHGTGHGVGVFLNVHEGPHHISPCHRGPNKEIPLDLNMVVTNEPGYYETNDFGVRIENVLVVRRSSLEPNKTTGDIFYEFEDLTLIPYQKKMIEHSLLTAQEIEQIDAYHRRVWDSLRIPLENSTSLQNKDQILTWLRHATAPLDRT